MSVQALLSGPHPAEPTSHTAPRRVAQHVLAGSPSPPRAGPGGMPPAVVGSRALDKAFPATRASMAKAASTPALSSTADAAQLALSPASPFQYWQQVALPADATSFKQQSAPSAPSRIRRSVPNPTIDASVVSSPTGVTKPLGGRKPSGAMGAAGGRTSCARIDPSVDAVDGGDGGEVYPGSVEAKQALALTVGSILGLPTAGSSANLTASSFNTTSQSQTSSMTSPSRQCERVRVGCSGGFGSRRALHSECSTRTSEGSRGFFPQPPQGPSPHGRATPPMSSVEVGKNSGPRAGDVVSLRQLSQSDTFIRKGASSIKNASPEIGDGSEEAKKLLRRTIGESPSWPGHHARSAGILPLTNMRKASVARVRSASPPQDGNASSTVDDAVDPLQPASPSSGVPILGSEGLPSLHGSKAKMSPK